ncbi:MAG: hypothetical protein CMF43_05435 [Legionellales bacterium]|nr:hypothetical protein [Legionellales bacterium]
MAQILFRTVCFVKLLCLLAVAVYAESTVESTAESSARAYRVELLAYQQSEGAAFGNVQPSKYTHLVDDTPLVEIDTDRAYVDTKYAPALKTLAQRLQRDGIANRLFSWVVKLQPQESLTLPVDATISLAVDNPAESTIDGFSLRGQLLVSRNQYIDITSQQTIHMLRSGQTYQFDYTEHSRHLKLDKTHYLDNERIGMLLKVTAAEFSPPPPVQPAVIDAPVDTLPNDTDSGSAVVADSVDVQQPQPMSTDDQSPTPIDTPQAAAAAKPNPAPQDPNNLANQNPDDGMAPQDVPADNNDSSVPSRTPEVPPETQAVNTTD